MPKNIFRMKIFLQKKSAELYLNVSRGLAQTLPSVTVNSMAHLCITSYCIQAHLSLTADDNATGTHIHTCGQCCLSLRQI